MKKVLVLLSLCVIAWSEPLWITNPTYNGKYIATVGIAEAHFPKHVQERVALVRAKAKLSDMQSLYIKENEKGAENVNPSKSELDNSTASKVEIKDKYIDEEGNLYLWVITY